MIVYAPRAEADILDLRNHYVRKGYTLAIRALDVALTEAENRIITNPAGGLPAPRPYPALAKAGRLWVLAGRYWIAYRPGSPCAIIAVFYDQANIPGRL